MTEQLIDLRSDTVTGPTAGMRAAMAAAEVGDDVYGEDPTVRVLEERVAELLGKEAAVYLPSGTMCNEIALKVHTRPGDEVLADRTSHLIHFEGGAPGLLSGVLTSALHESFRVPWVELVVIRELDGVADEDAVVDRVLAELRAAPGALVPPAIGKAEDPRRAIAEHVAAVLERFGRHGFFVGGGA